MGLMSGKAQGGILSVLLPPLLISIDTLIILDSYPLPVEGTETRVNASADANIYISRYAELGDEVTLTLNLPWLNR